MATRTVTGQVYRPNGLPWAGVRVDFRLVDDTFTLSPDASFPKIVISGVTAADGSFSVTLAAGLSVPYEVTMPDGETFSIVVAEGSPITLEVLRAEYIGANPAALPTLDLMMADIIENSAEFEALVTEIVGSAAAQPLDADLTAIAGLTPTNDDILQRKSGAWTNRTLAQLKTDLSLQPLDADLTAIAALAPPDNDIMQRKSGSWVNRSMAQLKTDLALSFADITGALGYTPNPTLSFTPANIIGDIFTGLVRFRPSSGVVAAAAERFSADALGLTLTLRKSRHATAGSHTIVASGDTIGGVTFEASNGTAFVETASISAAVDGTPGASNDMPSRLSFFTTADGAGTPAERLRISNGGDVRAFAPLGGIGYGTGAGASVTQATSKSTGVTINAVCGRITMNGASLTTGAEVRFTVTNSAVEATDVVLVVIASGATTGTYQVGVDAVAAGSFRVVLASLGTTGADTLVLNFVVIKSVIT